MMTQVQYAQYLGQLIQVEIDTESEYLEEQFLAYFQAFMPYGEHIERVFEPLPNCTQLCERIKPIFKATENVVVQSLKEGITPAYFVPPKQHSADVIPLGEALLAGFIKFAKFIKVKPLQKYLAQINEVVISESEKQNFDDEAMTELYEVLSIWLIESTDYDGLLSLLSEAYYSISNDYFLSAYLQYPALTDKPKCDFLQAYFELWKRGFNFVINGNRLILF